MHCSLALDVNPVPLKSQSSCMSYCTPLTELPWSYQQQSALLAPTSFCGARSTNYKKWFSSAEPYPIKFKSGYEPYVLVARKIMPWYDERFRGYGWDKVRLISSTIAL